MGGFASEQNLFPRFADLWCVNNNRDSSNLHYFVYSVGHPVDWDAGFNHANQPHSLAAYGRQYWIRNKQVFSAPSCCLDEFLHIISSSKLLDSLQEIELPILV